MTSCVVCMEFPEVLLRCGRCLSGWVCDGCTPRLPRNLCPMCRYPRFTESPQAPSEPDEGLLQEAEDLFVDELLSEDLVDDFLPWELIIPGSGAPVLVQSNSNNGAEHVSDSAFVRERLVYVGLGSVIHNQLRNLRDGINTFHRSHSLNNPERLTISYQNPHNMEIYSVRVIPLYRAICEIILTLPLRIGSRRWYEETRNLQESVREVYSYSQALIGEFLRQRPARQYLYADNIHHFRALHMRYLNIIMDATTLCELYTSIVNRMITEASPNPSHT